MSNLSTSAYSLRRAIPSALFAVLALGACHRQLPPAALRYREDCAPAEVRDPEAAANFVLMMLVGMSDPGLIILPTHRLLSGLPALTCEQLKAKLAPHFDIVEESTSARDCWETVELDGSQNVLGFGALKAGLAFLPMAISIIIGAQVSSHLLSRLGVRPLLLVGTALACGGFACPRASIVLGAHGGGHAAADIEAADYFHMAGSQHGDEVVEYGVHHRELAVARERPAARHHFVERRAKRE